MTLSSELKQRIVTLHEHTLKSKREIGREWGVSHTLVQKTMKISHETGSLEEHDTENKERKLKLSDRSKKLLVRESVKDPKKIARVVQEAVGSGAQTVSVRTIQRYLVQRGRMSYRPIRAPLLKTDHKKRRLIWSKESFGHV